MKNLFEKLSKEDRNLIINNKNDYLKELLTHKYSYIELTIEQSIYINGVLTPKEDLSIKNLINIFKN